MLGSVAVRGVELLAAAAAAGILLLVVAAAAGWWLRRLVRRRVEALGRQFAGRASRAAAGAAGGGWRWVLSRPLPDRRWAASALARRRLWRAVGAAEHAVARAREAGAPVGDLDGLCRRLREAARGVDRALVINGRTARAAAGGGTAPSLIGESLVGDLVAVAGRIQATASEAAAAVSRPAVSGLSGDVAREVAAVSAGIDAIGRAGFPGPR
jgi:hypothetical protein